MILKVYTFKLPKNVMNNSIVGFMGLAAAKRLDLR